MKRWFVALSLTLTLLAASIGLLLAGDDVAPEQVCFTNYRGQTSAFINSSPYWQGDDLIFTNCLLLSGTSLSGATQGLSSVTVDLAVGSANSHVDYVGSVTSTNGGTWSATITVPSVTSPNIQITITDASTNVYTYPWMYMSTKAKM